MMKKMGLRLIVVAFMLVLTAFLLPQPALAADGITVNVTVNWYDGATTGDPPQITVYLLKDGTRVENKQIVLTQGEELSSSGSFTELEAGTYGIEASISEKGYTTTISGSATSGFEINVGVVSNSNAFDLTFAKMAELDSGNVLYQLYVKQTAGETRLSMLDMNFSYTATGADSVSFVKGHIFDPVEAYDWVTGVDGDTFNVHFSSWLLSDGWQDQGEGFTPLALVEMSGECNFSLEEGGAISNSGYNVSAAFKLVTNPADLAITTVTDDDGATKVTITPQVPFNGLIVCAAYNSDKRMLASSFTSSAGLIGAIPTNLLYYSIPLKSLPVNLKCDYNDVAEVRVFAVDADSWQPLCPKVTRTK